MRKDSFGRNQHLLILRVHSISVTMDMRNSFPELWLLGFPVFCLLICSTVSHREGKKWKDVIFQGCFLSVTALLTVDILSRLWSFFQYLVLIFHQVRLPTQKAQNNHSDYFLSQAPTSDKGTVRKSYFELFLLVEMGCSETSTQVSQFKTMLFRGRSTTYIWDSETKKHCLHKIRPFITLCFNESEPLINDAHRTPTYKLDKSLVQKNLLDTPWSFWPYPYTVAVS